MSQILTYVGLHFKLALKKDKKSDSKSEIATFLIGLLTCAVVIFLLKYLFEIINKQILSEISPKQFSVVIISIIEVALVIIGIVFEIRFFLKPKDASITARLPLSVEQLFIAQLLIVYIYLLAISFVLIIPVMLVFASASNILSVAFVIGLIPTCFFASLLPFAFATLFVVPIAYLVTLIENKNILKLILFLVALAVAFFLYSKFLNFLAEYYIHQRVDASAKNLIINFISVLDNGWNFFSYTNNIMFGFDIWKSLGIILSITIVILAMGILLAIPVHKKTRLNVITKNTRSFYKQTKISQDSAFVAIFKNEFKNIIRTHTYAYFYLGIAIVTPVMVLLTNNLIQKLGTAQIGSSIVFGISLVIMLVFMCIINSFSASAISREGKQFYITKIVPVDYKLQLLAKGLLNFVVSSGALLLSIAIICGMRFISVTQGLVVLMVSLIMTIGVIINGFNIDAGNPNINKREHGEESQLNSTIMLTIGFAISAIEGLMAIVLTFFINEVYIYLIIFAVVLVYCIINALVFHFTINKRYQRIE